jgi:hypothetical protein
MSTLLITLIKPLEARTVVFVMCAVVDVGVTAANTEVDPRAVEPSWLRGGGRLGFVSRTSQ